MVGEHQLHTPSIGLERVQLRPFAQGDAEALHQLLSDAIVMTAFHHDAPPSLDQVKLRLPQMIAGEINGPLRRLYIAVADKMTADLLGMLVGMVETFEAAADLHGAEVAARTFKWER